MTELICKIASANNVTPELALAIAYVESGYQSYQVRYEPKWEYLVNPEKYSYQLRISLDTEICLQMLSWNCLQIMGSNARVLGYSGLLTYLINPDLGILYGIKMIRALQKKYPIEEDLISSYNQGHPAKLNGKYKNQNYVDHVCQKLKELRG